METRPLGNSDFKITPIGIGTWAIGGPDGNWNWGPKTTRIPSPPFTRR